MATYSSNPVKTPPPHSSGSYLDLRLSADSSFSSVVVKDCNLAGGTALDWWNGASWALVTPESYIPGSPPCVEATLGSTSSPSLTELDGTVFSPVTYQGYEPVSPLRICDTRSLTEVGGVGDVAPSVSGPCANKGVPLSSGSPLSIQVGGLGGVPSSASAVVLNVTATDTQLLVI